MRQAVSARLPRPPAAASISSGPGLAGARSVAESP